MGSSIGAFSQHGRAGKKGQMFLIGALIIVGILAVLRYNITYPSAAEEKKAMESRLENEIFSNIVNELNNSMRFSYDNPGNITQNIFDLANFTKSKINERSLNLRLVFVGVIANKTTNLINVSLINMLDKTVRANLTMSDGQTNSSYVQNYGKWDTVFDINPGSHYTMSLDYGDYIETINIVTKKNKDVYTGFFYISLEGEDTIHRLSFERRMNL